MHLTSVREDVMNIISISLSNISNTSIGIGGDVSF